MNELDLRHGMAERIRHLRQHRNLTQDQLAQAIGLSRTALVNIESGIQKVTVQRLVLLSDALEVTLDWLVRGSASSTFSPPAEPGSNQQSEEHS